MAFVKQKQIADLKRVKDKEKEAQEKYILHSSLGFALILFGLALVGYRRKKRIIKLFWSKRKLQIYRKRQLKKHIKKLQIQ